MAAAKYGLESGRSPSSKALERIAASLEKLAGQAPEPCDFESAGAFVFAACPQAALMPVPKVSRVDLSLLQGIDRARDTLLANTERFARGFAANNALLWGARGMGKSALVKAAHAAVNARLCKEPGFKPLKLVEIHREDIASLPALMAILRASPWRFLLFCDDLSFDVAETSYRSLKAALEGGIEGRPANVLFYATSNRRQLSAKLSNGRPSGARARAARRGNSSRTSPGGREKVWTENLQPQGERHACAARRPIRPAR